MSRIVSCFTNNYGAHGVRTAAERIRDTGIHHLELALRGHNLGGLVIPEEVVVTEKADDATASEFVDFLQRHQVEISGCNIGGGDMRTEEGLALSQRRLRFAKRWFSVPVVISGASQPTNAEERQAVVRHLRQLGETGAEQGVTVALETHKGPTQNADAMLALMSEVDHPNIRLNFDTANIVYYNPGVDVLAELRRVVSLVRNVHLKDCRGVPEDWYFPALGEGGAIDFRAVREILDEVGYKGAYTIEIEGIQGEPEPGLEGRQTRIKASVDHLRACGYFD